MMEYIILMNQNRKKPSNSSDNLYELLSDVMENLTEENRRNAQAINDMKPVVTNTREMTLEILKKFQNGFRQEIKNYIALEIKTQTETLQTSFTELGTQIKEQGDRIDANTEKIEANGVDIRAVKIFLRKPQYWLKLLTALLLGIAAVGTVVSTFCDYKLIKSPTSQTVN